MFGPCGVVQIELHPMSAFGCITDVIQGVAEGPLIAKMRHSLAQKDPEYLVINSAASRAHILAWIA